MPDYVVVRDIAAPIETAWALLADVQRWPETTASMTSLTPLDRGPLGEGSRVVVVQPKLAPATMVVTLWQPPRRFVWRNQSRLVRMTADHLLETTAAGCRVTLTMSIAGPLMGLVSLFWSGLIVRYMTMEAEGLKAHAERRHGGAV